MGVKAAALSSALVVHVLVAAEEPVAVVLRGGPPEHWRVFRWDLDTGEVESGAVLQGNLHPRRSAISPDGLLLAYFASTRQKGDWGRFLGVSKVPWLTALAAWRWPERGFSPAGAAFVAGRLVLSGVEAGGPFEGRSALAHDFGPVSDRTWKRGGDGDEKAAAVLPLRHPQRRVRVARRGDVTLLEVWDALELTDDDVGLRRYVLGGRPLEGVQWAGFAPDGAALVATRDGRLQVRDPDGELQRDDGSVADPGPDRAKSPAWARRW